MALPQLKTHFQTPAEIIDVLQQSRTLPEHALASAVALASELEEPVLAVVNKAANGAYLLPTEANLLFWGIHALAESRRVWLYRPLLRLLQEIPDDDLDFLLGDAVTETLSQIVISVFDGDPAPLIEACAEPENEGFVRYSLMKALARLTFDGKVPRELTLEFLDRFEREALAEARDPAWSGWVNAVALLGVEALRERACATWEDGRNDPTIEDCEYFQAQLTLAQSLAPGDAALFDRERARPLEDVAQALQWTAPRKHNTVADANEDLADPAGAIALQPYEIGWLRGLLRSGHMYFDTMSFEQIDGFFTALIAGPPGASLDRYLPFIWNHGARAEPVFEDEAQKQYVRGLLTRHWTCIGQRLDAGVPFPPTIARWQEWPGYEWALGFQEGEGLRADEWRFRRNESGIGKTADAIFGLTAHRAEARSQGLTSEMRAALIKVLPERLVTLHHAWRGRPDPFPPPTPTRYEGRKVGRNEPCPCGSGKKFKRCCGSPTGTTH